MQNNFDNTALIALIAFLLISWAKYNSERYACIDGNCLEIADGEFSSRTQCQQDCATDAIKRLKNKIETQRSTDYSRISSLWGDAAQEGGVWYSNDTDGIALASQHSRTGAMD